MSFGKRIRALREKQGILHQKDLADRANLSQATISRIEGGQVTQPRSEPLKRLAEALGVTMNYLMDPTETLLSTTVSDIDATIHYLASVYRKLSPVRRDQLTSFAQFLEEQEAKNPLSIPRTNQVTHDVSNNNRDSD